MSALCGFPSPDNLEPKNIPNTCDVCGYVEKRNKLSFTYPVGDKTYHLCSACVFAAASYWPNEAQRKRNAELVAERNARRSELLKERNQVAR